MIGGVSVMLLVIRAALLLAVALLPPPSWTQQAVSHKLRRSARQRTVTVFLDPSVVQVSTRSDSTTANMSLSPWTYRESFVESRIPSRISQAECLTSSCLDPRGGGEMAGLLAQPIKYEVLVLHIVPSQNLPTRRRRRQKNYELRLGVEVVTVGCTCVRPSVLLQH